MAGITDNFRLLDGPIGINERHAEDNKNRAIRNNSLGDKQTLRLGRRAYRAALKGQDPSNYIKGMQALEDMRMTIGTTGAGIKMAGVDEAAGQQRFQNVQRSIGLAGSPTSNIGLAGSGGSNIGLAGSAGSNISLAGSEGSNVGSAGSEGSNIGLAGSQKSNITLPAYGGREIVGSKTSTGEKFLSGKVELIELGAANPGHKRSEFSIPGPVGATGNSSTPASSNLTPEELASVEMKSQSLSERDAQARVESNSRGAFGTGNSPLLDKILNPRKAFAQDLSSSKLVEDQNPEALANAYARGESLGVSRNQVNSFLGLPAENAPVQPAVASPQPVAHKSDSLMSDIRGLTDSILGSRGAGKNELGGKDQLDRIRGSLASVEAKDAETQRKRDAGFAQADATRSETLTRNNQAFAEQQRIMGIQTAQPVQPPRPLNPETQDASTQNQPSGPSGLNVKFGEMPFNEKTSPAEKYRRLIASGYTEKQAAELAGIQNKSNAGIFEGSLMGNLFNKLNSF